MNITLVPRLALPRIVRSTLLCDCGQNMVFSMLHTSMMSPTRNRVSISTRCRKSSSNSALQPLNPRWMSEMKTVRNRSGEGVLRSTIYRPPNDFAPPHFREIMLRTHYPGKNISLQTRNLGVERRVEQQKRDLGLTRNGYGRRE